MSYDPLTDMPDPYEARHYMDDEKFIAYLLNERRWLIQTALAFREEAGLTYKHVRAIEIMAAAKDCNA